jgi:hypothetical protein
LVKGLNRQRRKALSKKPGFITAEIAKGAEFKTVPIHACFFSDASAFSVHSAVKLEDIVGSLENSTVPG